MGSRWRGLRTGCFIWRPPPSTPRPVTPAPLRYSLPVGYRGPMVMPHPGTYAAPMAVYRPSGQAAVCRAPAPAQAAKTKISFSLAPPARAPSSTTSAAAAPSSTSAPPQHASTPASEPAPLASSAPSPAAALAKEVEEKKLFVSETALAPPAQGTMAAASADDASSHLDLAPVSKKGLANPARPGLATVGKKVMIRANHFLVNVADNNLFHYDETKALRIWMQMDVETGQASPALGAHLQTSPKPQVSKYLKKKTSSSHSRNGKDDANHDSHDSRSLPQSRQSLTFDTTPTYHAGAFYEIGHDKLLTEEVNGAKRKMEQLMCKDDGDFNLSLKEKYHHAVWANENIEKQVFSLKDMCENVVKRNTELKKEISSFKNGMVQDHELAMKIELPGGDSVPLQVGSGRAKHWREGMLGGQYRPVRKSSYRGFSSSADNRDLKPLFEVIGEVKNVVHWPLNGTLLEMQTAYDKCIGHQRLYHCIHGNAVDVSGLLGSQKILFTTSCSGTLYVRVTYLDESDIFHEFTMVNDARFAWNMAFQNKQGIYEYKDTSAYPYMAAGTVQHLDFQSHYADLCPQGHGFLLMGPEALKTSCMILSTYSGEQPSPPHVRMALATFIHYLSEGVKFHDAHYFNSQTIKLGSVCTLEDIDIALSPLMKKWFKISKPPMDFLLRRLNSPSVKDVPIPMVEGIDKFNAMLDCIAIRPITTLTKPGTNSRTWTSFLEDHCTDNGAPHALSSEYLRRWPYNQEIVLPPKRNCNIPSAMPYIRPIHHFKDEKYTKFMDLLKPAANHVPRHYMLQKSVHASKLLAFLKTGVVKP